MIGLFYYHLFINQGPLLVFFLQVMLALFIIQPSASYT